MKNNNIECFMEILNSNDDFAGKIGEQLAICFRLKKDKEHKDRFVTDWGTKTTQGIARVAARVLFETK